MIEATQSIIDISRLWIPDPKTRMKSIRGEEIGRTSLPTLQRESFYLPYPAIGSIFLYVKPYKYSVTASISTATLTDKVFMYNATLQKCTFGTASEVQRPDQFKPVLAYYEFMESVPYLYTDNELVGFLPGAISYLNNTYKFSYTYTGTISTFQSSAVSDDETELISRVLAVVVRKSFVAEQMRKGLGVAFRGPMASIDSKTQLKEYQDITKSLEKAIEEKAFTVMLNSGSQIIDIYTENVVDA